MCRHLQSILLFTFVHTSSEPSLSSSLLQFCLFPWSSINFHQTSTLIEINQKNFIKTFIYHYRTIHSMPRKRFASPDNPPNAKRSKKTGHPTRPNAGQINRPAGFVDPEEVISDAESDIWRNADGTGDESDSKGRKPTKPRWSRKRGEASTATGSARSFSEDPEENFTASNRVDKVYAVQHICTTSKEVVYMIQIPTEHEGTLIANIDLDKLNSTPAASGGIPQALVVTTHSGMQAADEAAMTRASSSLIRGLAIQRTKGM